MPSRGLDDAKLTQRTIFLFHVRSIIAYNTLGLCRSADMGKYVTHLTELPQINAPYTHPIFTDCSILHQIKPVSYRKQQKCFTVCLTEPFPISPGTVLCPFSLFSCNLAGL